MKNKDLKGETTITKRDRLVMLAVIMIGCLLTWGLWSGLTNNLKVGCLMVLIAGVMGILLTFNTKEDKYK